MEFAAVRIGGLAHARLACLIIAADPVSTFLSMAAP